MVFRPRPNSGHRSCRLPGSNIQPDGVTLSTINADVAKVVKTFGFASGLDGRRS